MRGKKEKQKWSYLMIWDRGKCFEVLTNEYFSPSHAQDLRARIESTAVKLCESVFGSVGAPYWFTDHGVKHSDHVFYYALQIARVANEYVSRLSEIEAIILACACYVHDLGMVRMPKYVKLEGGWTSEKVGAARSKHVEMIDETLEEYKNDLLPLYKCEPYIEHVLPKVCKAHGSKNHIAVCQEFSKNSQHYNGIRGDLLGKILLLADELDLGWHRSLIGVHPQFSQFPISAKAHQYKNHYVLGVEMRLPVIDISFVFPDDMSREVRTHFKTWVCHKLQQQIRMVSEGLVVQYKRIFEMSIRPLESGQYITRVSCPKKICVFIKDLVEAKQEPRLFDEELAEDRPNHFHPSRMKTSEPDPLYPVMNNLMDTFFRECFKPAAGKLFNELYIRTEENMKVALELKAQLDQYLQLVRTLEVRKRLTPFEPFLITGPTGGGKSALIRHMEKNGILCTRFHRGGSGILVIHIDCLPLTSYTEFLRRMLELLAEECRNRERIWNTLRSQGWTKYLKSSKIAFLTVDDILSTLNSVIELLVCGGKGLRGRIAVCYVLDNVDRVPGLQLKKQIYSYSARSCKSRGFPFIVLTLRYGTKHLLDFIESDDLPPLPAHRISCPSAEQVLQKRLEVAFSDAVVGTTASWYKPATVETVFGKAKIPFVFSDLRRSLTKAMETLSKSSNPEHPAFIPAMSGKNMRNALTLYRMIMKTVSKKELLVLSHGEIREHYLLRRAILEQHTCYFESDSKIRNIFNPMGTGHYFSKIYILQILRNLQLKTQESDFVSFGLWRSKVREYNILERDFRREANALLVGELALLEIEGSDDTVPNDRFKHIEDVTDEIGIKLSSAGEYYLDWLIFDFAYLQCILQDTLLPLELARDIGKAQISVEEATRQVNAFIDFLDSREVEERIEWRPRSLQKIIPKILKRLELQKKTLLAHNCTKNANNEQMEKLMIKYADHF
jgi:hypothetical protein